MSPSAEVEAFIKGWEQCRLTPYLDAAGLWTVGWGHRMLATDADDSLTQADADALFGYELLHLSDHVSRVVLAPVSQNQYDALLSFAYNAGEGALACSTLLKRVNGGYFAEAATEFDRWNHIRDPQTNLLVVSAGLTKRRAAERAMFENADYSGRP